MKQKLFSRIIIGVVVFSLAVGLVFIPTHRAQAFLGIGDITFDPTNWIESILQFAQTTAKWLADEAYAVLRDAVVKRIVDDLTDQIISSIENGGKPLFVQDFNAYLNQAGDLAFDSVNNFLIQRAGLSLCAPFQPQLTLYFYNNIAGSNGINRNFGFPAACRFQDFKQNIKNSETFIQNGGWIGLQQLFLPENNLLGATLALDASYYSQAGKIVQERQAAYQVNKGFLSVEQCVLYESPYTGKEVGPDQFQSDARLTCNEIGRTDTDQCISEFADAYCLSKETKTPGDVIAQSATKGVLKDFEYASNVNSVISALVNTFIENLFDKGKGLLFASTSHGGSGLAGSTINLSGEVGDAVGLTLQDKWDKTKRALDEIGYKYYLIDQYLNDPKNGLIQKARQGRALAINAIYECYMNRATSENSPDGEPYGWLNYIISNQISYIAPLSTLVTMPISSSTPPEYQLEGEPELLSLVSDAYRSQIIHVDVYSSPEKGGASVGRTWPPKQDHDFVEGYFEKLIRGAKEAAIALKKEQDALADIKAELLSISTSTTKTITVKDENGNETKQVVDNTASSTAAFSKLISEASDRFTTFVRNYKNYVQDGLVSYESNTGPGSSGQDSDVLGRILDGLRRFSPHEGDTGAHQDSKITNFFYCHPGDY